MKTATVAEVEGQFSTFLKDSVTGPVVVTRNGKPVAVILGVHDDDEVERLLMATSPPLQSILAKSRKQIRNGESLGHEEFWKEVKASRTSSRRGKKRKTGTLS